MLRHKNIDRVCCIVLALTLLISTLFVGAAAGGLITEDTVIGYETRLFDQSRVHTIDIVMQDWEAFLDTATSEEYAACHLVIDGESFKNVAIRGKGNTSLSSVQAYGNDRYSFKVEFDHYQSGATYHGLDKLSLNNLIQDNTYMKDYFAYTLMSKMGVAAPLCSFVQISVNGEPWGLYLAVEGVEDAFLQRNYGKDHGELYKPDSMSFGGGRGNGRDFDMDEMTEKFGFSFGGDDGDGSNEMQTFTMPDMSSFPGMSSMPEGFESSRMMGGFSSQSNRDSATAAPTATPAPIATGDPSAPANGTMPDMGSFPGMSAGETPEGFDPSQMMGGFSGMPDSSFPSGGNPPEGFDPSQMPGGIPGGGSMPEAFDPSQLPGSIPGGTDAPDPTATPAPTEASANGAMPDMGSFPGMPGGEMPESFGPSQMGGDFQMPDMNFGGGFGSFGSSTDVKLQYSDDDPSSYSNIFGNAKTDITAADQARLIASLKALNEGDTSVVDTEAVICYMAVHNFLCNDDSYTGMMVHNYYLYEEDGVLAMIPWDYNLAYGTMSGSNATTSVNTDIDRLVSMGSTNDRPMADWITASKEYTAQYHTAYQTFMTTAFDSGWFAGEIDRVTAMIAPYVQNDPTAFCTYEEFQTGAETLKQFCLKRAQSVTHQLSGEETLVDASELTLSDMGTMGNMGGPGGDRGGFERPDRKFGGEGRDHSAETPNTESATGMPVFDVPAATPETSSDSSGSSSGQAADEPTAAPDAAEEPMVSEAPNADEERARPGSKAGFDMANMPPGGDASQGWIWVAVCSVLLAAALVFVRFYRINR